MSISKPHLEPTASGSQLARFLWRRRKAAHDRRWSQLSREQIDSYIHNRLKLDQSYWLFILGMNNSGTTLLSRLLGAHPEIRSLPREGQRYTKALTVPSDFSADRLWGASLDLYRMTENSDARPALRWKYDLAFCYESRPGVLLEKSPPNAVRGRWLQMHCQPCRFIAIHRNPYASCEGIRRRTGCDIETAARHWAAVNGALADDLPRLDRCITVSYEQLTDEPDASVERIEKHLNLRQPIDRSQLSRPLNVHNLDDAPTPLQNFNLRSIEKLTVEDLAAINKIAGPTMDRLGYQRIDSPPSADSGK